MADEGFRLPASSYDQLSQIIMAYASFAAPVPPSAVSKAVGIHESTISRNGGFLVGIGLLEGKNTKVLTSSGRNLARALEHEMPHEIRHNWREVLTDNDFIQKILSAVRIRRGMERSALQTHIAYSAGQARTELVLRGANALIDILRAGELLQEEDGKLLAVTEQAQRTPDSFELEDDVPSGRGEAKVQRAPLTLEIATPSSVQSIVSGPAISIQITIQCTAAEVLELGQSLRKMLRDLSSPDAEEIEGPADSSLDPNTDV